MNDQEVRDLWSAINDLRKGQGVQSELLARIEVMLSERCEARVSRIEKVEETQEEHDVRLKKLEQLRAQILLLAMIGSLLGGSLFAAIISYFGK